MTRYEYQEAKTGEWVEFPDDAIVEVGPECAYIAVRENWAVAYPGYSFDLED